MKSTKTILAVAVTTIVLCATCGGVDNPTTAGGVDGTTTGAEVESACAFFGLSQSALEAIIATWEGFRDAGGRKLDAINIVSGEICVSPPLPIENRLPCHTCQVAAIDFAYDQ